MATPLIERSQCIKVPGKDSKTILKHQCKKIQLYLVSHNYHISPWVLPNHFFTVDSIFRLIKDPLLKYLFLMIIFLWFARFWGIANHFCRSIHFPRSFSTPVVKHPSNNSPVSPGLTSWLKSSRFATRTSTPRKGKGVLQKNTLEMFMCFFHDLSNNSMYKVR